MSRSRGVRYTGPRSRRCSEFVESDRSRRLDVRILDVRERVAGAFGVERLVGQRVGRGLTDQSVGRSRDCDGAGAVNVDLPGSISDDGTVDVLRPPRGGERIGRREKGKGQC